jgi:exopolysaccharide biosynthesis glucuronosyltransferase PssD
MAPTGRKKILAVSSGGGHWVELLRLRPAFDGCEVVYATVCRSYRSELDGDRFCLIPDCNASQKLRMVWCAAAVFVLLLKVRPALVISTGAAPGYFALLFGRWLGADTIWLDSLANAEELSLSGRRVGRYAGLWLTQWPHLASDEGPTYRGRVL